ncbi:MAG: hypothetical protein JWM34_4805 [Ilumatobacteraceae bacterium]|nr:hypothetical protein [Ilumatobacteraceae bacterium]
MIWAIVGLIAVAACVAYFIFGRSADVASSHGVVDRQGSSLLDGDDQAPAGPGAEDERVVADGVIGPGPGGEQDADVGARQLRGDQGSTHTSD